MKTIDCTPTWESLIPLMIEVIKTGEGNSPQTMVEELTRLARVADRYIAKGKPNGHADFNKCSHQYVTLTEDTETVSILTKSGKQITVSVLERAGCADVQVHNTGLTESNGRDEIPAFEVIGFLTGRTPVPRTRVTLTTLMLGEPIGRTVRLVEEVIDGRWVDHGKQGDDQPLIYYNSKIVLDRIRGILRSDGEMMEALNIDDVYCLDDDKLFEIGSLHYDIIEE